jgi:prolyl 4-hydroxylase
MVYAFIVLLIILIALFFIKPFINKWWIKEPLSTISSETIGRGFCDINDAYEHPSELPNFITPLEGVYILEKATPLFSESTIVSGTDNNIRKSQTAWLPKSDPIVRNIIQRVCEMTNHPFENAEEMQVVKYDPDGYYNEHHDSCCENDPNCIEFEKRGGQRVVTMLIYLSDGFTGGGTHFPNLSKTYKPPKWGALLFYPMQRDSPIDGSQRKAHPLALHAGMPVESGQKYIANVWIRERIFT